MIGLFLFPKIAKNMEREKVCFPSCSLVLLLILGIRVLMSALPISPAIWPSSAS